MSFDEPATIRFPGGQAMLRRLWQSAMIRLATSARITEFMQSHRATSLLGKKYTGGTDATSAVQRAAELAQKEGICSSLYYLGEYIHDTDLIETNTRQKILVAKELASKRLDLHISFDPTQLGYSITPALARSNAEKVAAIIRRKQTNPNGVHCLMFDMEDASVIEQTIAMHDTLSDEGFPVALTMQAYLYRTMSDMVHQIKRGSRVRLVKGAFIAGSDISYTKRRDIKHNMRDIIVLMFSKAAKDSGFYPIIATHDEAIQTYALSQAHKNGWKPGSYEFEMLLGVRKSLAKKLAKKGERVRLYIPFGKNWWPYGIRRIGENPGNALLLARSLLD
jgi:proline dehydrogenase